MIHLASAMAVEEQHYYMAAVVWPGPDIPLGGCNSLSLECTQYAAAAVVHRV